MNGALMQASLLAVGLSAFGSAQASVDEACLSVSFVDLGWTDIELATTTARQILERLGYETSSDLLALGITYEALKNDEMDVFMGNWQPAQDVEFAQYYEEGWVEVLGVNLEGAFGITEAAASGRQAAFDSLTNRQVPASGSGQTAEQQPAWAQSLRRQQDARHHRQVVAHTLREGDRGGASATPDIKERED